MRVGRSQQIATTVLDKRARHVDVVVSEVVQTELRGREGEREGGEGGREGGREGKGGSTWSVYTQAK